MRRISVLAGGGLDADDLDLQARIGAFEDGLKQLGWTNGQNVRIDIRAGAGDVDRLRRTAEELVALAPDVILATGASAVAPLLKATRTVPIVFTNVVDPVGAGFVDSLARPGGNATGFVMRKGSVGRGEDRGVFGDWAEGVGEEFAKGGDGSSIEI